MSDALAISGVTAVLQYCLTLVYNSPGSALAKVKVSAVAPDLVPASTGSSDTSLQVNLFLYQVMPNTAWRNAHLPSLGSDGGTRLRNPPLALDLHYLLTVYASEDTMAEALLGYAVLMLHENAILARSEIRAALNSVSTSSVLGSAITTTGLADQIEMLKITHESLSREETAWLWSALRSDYRPTYPFQVSVVLLESELSTSFALPVLSRSIAANGGSLGGLTARLPAHLSAVHPGRPDRLGPRGRRCDLRRQSLWRQPGCAVEPATWSAIPALRSRHREPDIGLLYRPRRSGQPSGRHVQCLADL